MFLSINLRSFSYKFLCSLCRRASSTSTSKRDPYTVVVEGNIGSGKTTFLQHFSKYGEEGGGGGGAVEVIEEPVDKWRNMHGHNLLQLMYEDPKRWAFMFQSYVHLTLAQRQAQESLQPPRLRIMERSLSRYCFVENLYNGGKLTNCEYTVLDEWFKFLATSPKFAFNVDLIVYLRTRPEIAYERILKRHRSEEEKLIPLQYIKDLHELHEDWLFRKTKFQPLEAPVVVIDANDDLDIMNKKYDYHEEQILKESSFCN